MKEGGTDVSVGRELRLLLLGFGPLQHCALDSRPNKFSFPLVFLQASPLVYMLAEQAVGMV